ncbi:hypothetical protein KP004_20040 [Geomonas oryzisoli]|uniref:Uncharacterized protein n=1 Tax=Geomonas oryzisoli TaxID=2847992 RepID=A0ABX8J556_9BACT|nr:hypothetical protein [Geomonas oryzisoli]QWV93423.1 hypothetical protein KP004_20040 [Geomonas oryzisoli]
MSSFQALLAARAHEEGKAQPTALYRHRAIAKDPLCIVAWQLGAEPYSPGAIAIGRQSTGFHLYVPGYPLDRDLLFAALLDFAKEFCPALESYANGPCEYVSHFGEQLSVPVAMPQIIVANSETIRLLGRLGRRLAYLPTEGPYPADPLLLRLGRHLMWLANHAHLPGQQLILSAADLLVSHYATAMSTFESHSLAALDAWIEPAPDTHGFNAAEVAEDHAVGPLPMPKDGEQVFKLMQAFNKARAGSKNSQTIQKLSAPLRAVYQDMTEETWDLIWKVIDRERGRQEAASVPRRADVDRFEYAVHLSWMMGPAEGRRKARMTARNAAVRLNELERTEALVLAEEAVDDPLRMAPHLLSGKALAGLVINSNPSRRELINGKKCLRPGVTVHTDVPCLMQVGTEVWWTRAPSAKQWRIIAVSASGSGSDVTLVLQTNRSQKEGLPQVGARACFSLFNTRPGYELYLPKQVPWTHKVAEPAATTDLDYNDVTGQAA